MKLHVLAVLLIITGASGLAQTSPVPDATAAERQRSINVGLCVARADQDTTVIMLLSKSNKAAADRFMKSVNKCAMTNEKIYPNIVMGSAAEAIIASRGTVLEDIISKKFEMGNHNKNIAIDSFACAIKSKPTSLVKMLNTKVGSTEEFEATQNFRPALLECNVPKGESITPTNFRAFAARAAFAMAYGG